MADKIQENVKELKKTDQLRRELIANVSHDLHSPLASIQGYLETISLKDHLKEKSLFKFWKATGMHQLQNKLQDECTIFYIGFWVSRKKNFQ